MKNTKIIYFLTMFALVGGIYIFIFHRKSYPIIFTARSKILNSTTKKPEVVPASLQRLYTPVEHDDMLDLISTVMMTLEGQQVPVFVNYGTLLGSLRHHDVTPWDDDADVGAPMDEKPRILTALKILASNKYESSWTAGTQIRVFGPYSKLWQQNWPWRWPYIDIDLYSQNISHLWFYNSGGVYTHPKTKIFPLHKRPLGTIQVNSPHDGLDCLTRMFSDLHLCTSGFNHRRGFDIKPIVSVPCSTLVATYSFVRRTVSASGGVVEVLQLDGQNISQLVSPEPAHIANVTTLNSIIV